ncbi:hypothetical protein GOPIP_063_00750 [Gordonia polyisoprenivorans NBRC 16320 = JCM 10675]|nr:hypothetical protein GOPIP_063_00750 [Gordonia polyisoprenivorans NBRC 16320 = JCM 10675]
MAEPDAVRAEIARLHPVVTAPEPSEWAQSQVAALGSIDDELAHTIAVRVDDLVGYADERYAREYLDAVARVHRSSAGDELTDAVARNLYKLMAYKDEYEVARLTADPTFAAQVADQYGADAKVAVRLHPPTLRAIGMKEKMSLGAWAKPGLGTLAKMKRLRGTRLDPFGYNAIRRTERALIGEYRSLVDSIVAAWESGSVTPQQYSSIVELAALPDMVRGYEGIKMANVARYRETVAQMRSTLGL